MIELLIVAALLVAATTGYAVYSFQQLNTLKAEKLLQEKKRERINTLVEVAQKLEAFGETMLDEIAAEDLDETLGMAHVTELAAIQRAISSYKTIGDRLEKRYTGVLNNAYAKVGFPVVVSQNTKQNNNQQQAQPQQQKN